MLSGLNSESSETSGLIITGLSTKITHYLILDFHILLVHKDFFIQALQFEFSYTFRNLIFVTIQTFEFNFQT